MRHAGNGATITVWSRWADQAFAAAGLASFVFGWRVFLGGLAACCIVRAIQARREHRREYVWARLSDDDWKASVAERSKAGGAMRSLLLHGANFGLLAIVVLLFARAANMVPLRRWSPFSATFAVFEWWWALLFSVLLVAGGLW